MARVRKKAEIHAGELNLTAMIDVAFQLLSFFVITIHPVDVITQLKVNTPSPESKPSDSKPPNIVKIKVLQDGSFNILGATVGKDELDRTLKRLADNDISSTVLIQCTPHSSHGKLIDVLDSCANNKLINLSVVSVQ